MKGVYKYNQSGFQFNSTDIEGTFTVTGSLVLDISGVNNGYVLTSDNNGNAIWSAPFINTDTNIANSNLTADDKRSFTILDNSIDSFTIKTINQSNILQIHTVNGGYYFNTSANFRAMGNTTSIESNIVNFTTNKINLNTSQFTGNPDNDFIFEFKRGSLPSSLFIWDELNDKFKISENSFDYYRILDERDYLNLVQKAGDTINGELVLNSLLTMQNSSSYTKTYKLYSDTTGPLISLNVEDNTVQTFDLKIYSVTLNGKMKIWEYKGAYSMISGILSFKGNVSEEILLEETTTETFSVTFNVDTDFDIIVSNNISAKWSGILTINSCSI